MELVSRASMFTEIDSSEAFVHTVVASIYDRSGVSELLRNEVILSLSKKKYLRHLHLEELIDLSMILCRDLGKREVIEQSVEFLGDHVKSSLYAICLDLILYNGHFDENELQFMIELGHLLGFGPDDSVRMIDLICIKNYGNYCDV